ncbi:MAG: efflux transporter outer membrane subunit [Gammaproteobacteria bacterium]|nr:efflux transporter outer membrane subunit [Gammaproteobacteria bacterium]MBT3488732.1 efflux transporter outer membrane subunit [Gammaproteobacteria bacterium]MBT3717983.1 efflux transporter outer membrane subunit [Gammaproteobacteria bacterium]MBT3845435.1 efflux transporter outer membrane subunit [Gammaproteobacteria bacterium]MBT3893942.1 efflux transporter outer membrane subunit [Gammaproteobacteria bacterium]
MKRALLLPLLAVTTLSGCTVSGLTLTEVKVAAPERYTALPGEQGPTSIQAKQNVVAGQQIPQQWWQLFGSEPLTGLVEQGLKNSPTIVAAAARLRSVEALYRAQQESVQLPTVDLSLGANRTQSSGATQGHMGSGSVLSIQNASLQFSYRADLFGGNRQQLLGAGAAVEVERYKAEHTRVALAANIVTTTIQLASLEAQITALQNIIEDESAHLAVTEQQYQIGVIPKSDLLSQRASLAQTRTRMPALRRAQALAQHQLALLIGTTAGEADIPKFSLDSITLPQTVPLSLPSELTRQRADIRTAEALLQQSAAAVGVATANRYPTLDLSGSFGTEVNQLSDLLSGGSAVWGVGAGLLHPLFHGDALRAQEASAVASYDQLAAEYRQQVLMAFREVADALRALHLDSEQLALTEEADRLASETLKLVEQQHKQGAVSYLTLLNAQRLLQQSRIDLIQARAALYVDSATLMVALGGGWWSETESTAQAVQIEQGADK